VKKIPGLGFFFFFFALENSIFLLFSKKGPRSKNTQRNFSARKLAPKFLWVFFDLGPFLLFIFRKGEIKKRTPKREIFTLASSLQNFSFWGAFFNLALLRKIKRLKNSPPKNKKKGACFINFFRSQARSKNL